MSLPSKNGLSQKTIPKMVFDPEGFIIIAPKRHPKTIRTPRAVSEPRRPEDVHLGMSLLQDSPQTHAAARLLHSLVPRPRLEGW